MVSKLGFVNAFPKKELRPGTVRLTGEVKKAALGDDLRSRVRTLTTRSPLTRVAIVGAGNIAQSHVDAVESMSDRAEVVAVVEVDPVRLASFALRHGIAGQYEDLDAMLAVERPDLAIVCTPPYLHVPQTLACLSAGVWVLCEKPVCGSLADLDTIEAAEGTSAARFSSVSQWRFGERVEEFRALIASGALGRPLVVECLTNWYRDQAYYDVAWRGAWSTELGGPTIGLGIHFMDLVLSLLGDWDGVVAMVGTLARDIEVEDVSMAVIRLASGALVSVVNSALSPRQETALRFDFEKATVELRSLYSDTDKEWVFTPLDGKGGGEGLTVWAPLSCPPVDRHALQLARFLDAMDGMAAVPLSVAEVRATYDLIASLYKAAGTGREVARGSIAAGDPYYERFAAVAASGKVGVRRRSTRAGRGGWGRW
jgi:predicted dehydrogenase